MVLDSFLFNQDYVNDARDTVFLAGPWNAYKAAQCCRPGIRQHEGGWSYFPFKVEESPLT